MQAFDRFRGRIEPAIIERRQRQEVDRATSHLTDFASIRSGYLRTRVEARPDEFEELMMTSQPILDRFDVTDADDLMRAAAAAVVHESRGEADRELWRPVWSERFDEAGATLEPPDVPAEQAAMLWTVAHFRSFGTLPENDRLTADIRPPLHSVPFYVFVHAPVDDLLDIAAGCLEDYAALTDDAESWIRSPR